MKLQKKIMLLCTVQHVCSDIRNLLILYGIRKSCPKSATSQLCYNKYTETGSSNYRGKSLLYIAYKIQSNILRLRLTPVIENHHCGYRRNSLTAGNIFCVRQTFKKNGNTMAQ
jgi:hypothetical protein